MSLVKCKKCGSANVKVDFGQICTSIPAKYEYKCQDCCEVGYVDCSSVDMNYFTSEGFQTYPMPQVKQPRYSNCFEYMFVFSKGIPKTFNPIMEPCKCAGQLYDSTAKNMDGESGRHKLTYNVNKEKVKSNIWEIAVAQNKTEHPAVYPYQIAYDHIKSWSNEGDLIYDPFMGSGTTAAAAVDLNRNWIGSEISEKYCDIIKERLGDKVKEEPLW